MCLPDDGDLITMPENKLILAIIEPDLHPQTVAERASWLARAHGYPLRLLLCDPDIGPLHEGWYVSNESRDIAASIQAAQQEMIEDIAWRVRKDGLEVTTGVLEDRPVAEAIIHEVNETQPAILVKGTAYHSAADRSFFVDTDWQLVRSAPCPLYLVKPGQFPDNAMIVAAVDPTHDHDKPAALDRVIIEAAQGIAGHVDGEVHLFHTYEKLVGVGSEATRTFKPIKIPLDEIEERMREEHRQALDALAGEFGIDEESVHQLPGSTRELLPMFSRTHNVGLVVMGGLARWSLKRAVIGSTAERVLDSLPCDVMIVRAPSED